MTIADELRKLQDLHRSGALSDDEFARAKQAVLDRAEGGEAAGAVQQQLDYLKQQNELMQLDREWESAREQFLFAGQDGHLHKPSKAGSVGVGVVMSLAGLAWTIFTFTMLSGDELAPAPVRLFPLFGLLLIGAGIGTSAYQYNKAGEYERAEARYSRRRREIVERQLPRLGPPDERITGA